MSDEAEVEQPTTIKEQEFLNQLLVLELQRAERVLAKLRARLEALTS